MVHKKHRVDHGKKIQNVLFWHRILLESLRILIYHESDLLIICVVLFCTLRACIKIGVAV